MTDYDLLIIGAGTGGMAAAKKAADYGVKVGLIEKETVGGTCLNRGCTPKKLMVYAADFALQESLAQSYGWHECDKPNGMASQRQLDWSKLMQNIHQRLDTIGNSFKHTFQEKGIDLIYGEARFVDRNTVKVKERSLRADKFIIAVGGHPIKPDFPGKELAITSRQMFQLPEVPRKIAIVGGGYIGVEFSSMMNAFGAEVVLMDTDESILSGFDRDLQENVLQGLTERGIEFIGKTTAKKIEREGDRLKLYLDNQETLVADKVLLATGRAPSTNSLDLDKAGVTTGDKGEIGVDEYLRTQNPNIYAVGDCIDRVPLTPVAKAEALAAIDTIYDKEPRSIDYTYVTSAVFARPEAATVGMNEASAREKYGNDVKCYRDRTTPMLYSLTDEANQKQIFIKLVTVGESEKIIGAHMVGEHAADLIQCLGVAVRKGITKQDLDCSFGIHPTVGEEFMTLY